MSQNVNRMLKELEQKTQNELFIKEQRQRTKPIDVKQAEKSQLSRLDEKLLVKEDEENVQDFDPNLIELDPAGEPLNIQNEIATKQTLLDTELDPIIQLINDTANEADPARRRTMMDNLIATGNLISATLTAELPAVIEYDDLQGLIDAVVDRRVNKIIERKPTANRATATNYVKRNVNNEYVPIIYNKNMQALENYRQAFLQDTTNNVQRENKSRLQKYVNRIENQNLYSNVINVQRIPGESDESYKERLDTYRNVPSFVDQQKLQLFQRERAKLKQNLLKLMNEVNAQRAVNIPEIAEANILDINKNIPRFLSEIKSNFQGLKIDEFMDYFTDYIRKVSGQMMKYETLDSKLEDKLNEATYDIEQKLDEIESKIKTKKPSKKSGPNYWQVEEVIKDAADLENGLPLVRNDSSKPPLRTKYKATTKDNIRKNQDVLDIIGNNRYLLDSVNTQNDRLNIDSLLKKLNPVVTKYRNKLMDDGLTKDQAKEETKKVFGYGISRPTKEFVPFGKLILDINRLVDQNKLRVLYSNHINVKEIKTTAVSQNFETIITQLLDSNKFNTQLFGHLDKSEQDLMVLLLQKAGLHSYIKDIDTKRDKEITKHLSNMREKEYSISKLPKETLDRWELVKGQIMAGNDNKNLVKEAINLVNTFKSIGHIDASIADEQIGYLKTLLN